MSELSFNDKLREAARALADGREQEIIIPHATLANALAGKKAAENPTSYIRTTMGRVPEVKAIGAVKVRKSECRDDESKYFGMDIYTITISTEKRKTVYTKSDVIRIKRKAVSDAASKLLLIAPNLANYEESEYSTVAKVMREMHALIKMNFVTEEEEDGEI